MRCCSTAQTRTGRFSRICKSFLVFMLMGLGALISLYSCVPTTTGIQSREKDVFRSDDYIVYKLEQRETPAALAGRFLGDERRSWVIEEANDGMTFNKGEFIVIPLKDRNKGGLCREGYQAIPILTYHRFGPDCKSPLCVPTPVFERQMRYLKEDGYSTITAEELRAFLEYRQSLPKKSVLITMDDGYHSVYSVAYPILKKFDFTAIIFIYTDFVGVSSSAITWDQLREMKANGFTIGSHTIFHSDLTKKKEGETEAEFDARVRKELFGAKEIIDKKLGQDTYILAYPYGRYDRRVIEYTREAGYTIAMSVKRGGNPFFADPLALRRDQILKREMQRFISRLKTFYYLQLE
jgi:peptidoglycan/xylan/chitin deacetylase (PgdA/CDA1 family)